MGYAKGLLRPDPTKLARRLHASLHPLLAAGGAPRPETMSSYSRPSVAPIASTVAGDTPASCAAPTTGA